MAGMMKRGMAAAAWVSLIAFGPSVIAQTYAVTDDQSIQSSPAPGGALFGVSVSGDGGLIAVGASDSSETALNGGAVFLFEQVGGVWTQVLRVEPDDVAPSDFAGFDAALSGDTLVAGAWGSDSVAYLSGAAYVFERDQGGADAWGQRAKLTAPDGADGDVFGWSVAVSGDLIAVGAPLDDSSGMFEAGGVYLYGRAPGSGEWGFLKKLVASDPNVDAQFGFSLAMDGDRLVVGSVGSNAQGNGAGAAYVFERDQGGADNWGFVTKLTGSDVDANDQFGQSVALDGDRVVVGAYRRDRENVFAGAVFVFDRDQGGAGAWGESATFRAETPVNLQSFGGSVSVSGGVLLVGAETTPVGGQDEAGCAYVYVEEPAGVWSEALLIEPPALTGEGDLLGGAVSLMPEGDGWQCVIGARGEGGALAPFTGGARVVAFEEELACPADLAAPMGVLNFFDISAFIGLFNTSDPAADFAAPFGVLNFFDISAFIAAFNAGCP